MVYPGTPLPLEVGLQLAGVWTDAVTTGQGVLERHPVAVRAGRSNWAGQVDPSRATFLLRDQDGRWSPDNQAGPYWPNLKRNIPCRVGVGFGSTYLEASGQAGKTTVSTPNAAGLSFGTSHDVRIEFRLDAEPQSSSAPQLNLANKLVTGPGAGWFWRFYRNPAGMLVVSWVWFDSGNVQRSATTEQTGSVVPYWTAYQRVTFRTTWDPSTGTTTFYYGTGGVGGSFTQIGSPVVTGATSMATNTAAVVVGGDAVFGATPLQGQIYNFQLRNGIGGTVVANPVFEGATLGAATVTDGIGNVWTPGTGGRITNLRWRFYGEVASLPVRWDLSGQDVTAPIEAAGILRRLRQGAQPLDSALRRATVRSSGLVEYWPCEETGDTVPAFGAAVGQAPMTVIAGGFPKTGGFKGFVASKGLPELGLTVWEAKVDSYPIADWQLRWLMAIPATLTGTGVSFLRIQTSDMLWELQWQTNGDLKVRAYRGNTNVYDSGFIGFNATGALIRAHFHVKTNGSNVDWQLQTQTPGGVSGGITITNAVAGSPGVVGLIRFNPEQNMGATAVGHITLNNVITDPATDLATALNAYQGEAAARRVQRLCVEEGIPSRIKGDPDDTELMGPQTPAPLVDLLQQCADADGGILSEARESAAVGFRSRVSMQSQTPVAYDYAAGHLAGTIDVDRDDQRFANDITVTATTGTTGRAQLNDGTALSVSQPPTGAGRYATTFDANCSPGRVNDLAGWRLRISAVDEPRISKAAFNTNQPAIIASSTLTESILTLAIGDAITIANLPGMVLGSIIPRQLVQGTSETIGMFSHQVELNTSPASPWDTRLYDATDCRYDTAGSTLVSGVSAGATSLSVATSLGPLWTTVGGDLPFDVSVGGVRVTVTAISGAASPQTVTVSAVSRALAAGATIQLADATYYEL
jgi:hypothetical protein